MPQLRTTLEYFALLLVMESLVYFLGHSLLRYTKVQPPAKPWCNFFCKLVVGSTLFVFLTAVLVTKGRTVLLLLAPLAAEAWRLTHRSPAGRIDPRTGDGSCLSKTRLSWVLAASVAFYLLRFGQIFNPHGAFPLIYHPDYVFYANCTDYIAAFGNENASVDYLSGPSSGTSPYHYYDLWLGLGISRLFRINTMLASVLLVMPFALVTIYAGLCAIIERFRPPRSGDLAMAFLLVFFSGLSLQLYTHIGFMADIEVFAVNAWSQPKSFPVYIYGLGGILLLASGLESQATLCLLAVPVASVSTAPALLPALALYSVFLSFSDRIRRLRSLAAVICSGCGLLAFYTLLTPPTQTHVATSLSMGELVSLKFLRTSVNIAVGATLQIVLLFLPPGLLLMRIRSLPTGSSARSGVGLAVLIYTFALLGWAVLHQKMDAVQIFSNPGMATLNICTYVFLLAVWTREGRTAFETSYCLILVFWGLAHSLRHYRLEYPQSPTYLAQVRQESKELSRLGAFIFSEKDYRDRTFSFVDSASILGYYLAYSETNTFPMSLSPYTYPLSSASPFYEIERCGIESTPFYRFCEKLKSEGRYVSIDQAQTVFIDKLRINYLIVSREAVVGEQLSLRIAKVYSDAATGEKFCLLAPPTTRHESVQGTPAPLAPR